MTLNSSRISYGELFIAVVLQTMLIDGQRGKSACLIPSTRDTMLILKFLAVNIKKLADGKMLPNNSEELCDEFCKQAPLCERFVADVTKNCSFPSIDHMLTQIDSMKDTFQISVVLQSNTIVAPTIVCPGSIFHQFCRSLIAKFESMSFEEVSDFYSNVCEFKRRKSKSNSKGELQLRHQQHMYDNDSPLQELLDSTDLSHAETTLHNLLDGGGTRTNFDFCDDVIISPPAAASTTAATAIVGTQKDTKHQKAMMILATLWTKHSHYNLAYFSIEEAMKVSHQRGDHSAIATSLLILHYLFNEEMYAIQNIPVYSSTHEFFDETILSRCLEQCGVSKHRLLASQALILLANLKCQRMLSYSNNSGDNFSNDDIDHDIVDDVSLSSSSSSYKVQNVWNMLNVSLYGDLNSMLNCHKSSFSQSTESGTATATTAIITPSSTQNGQNKTATADGGLLSIEEYFEVYIPNALSSIQLWLRLNIYSMAELQCRQVLRVVERNKNRFRKQEENIFAIYCKYIKLMIDSTSSLNDILKRDNNDSDVGKSNNNNDNDNNKNKHKNNTDQNVFVFAHRIIRLLEQNTSYQFQNNSNSFSNIFIQNNIESLKLYIHLRESLANKSKAKQSLRLAIQYKEFFSECDDNNKNGDNSEIVSIDHFEAKTIYALALSKFNLFESYQQLLSLSAYRNHFKYRLLALKAYLYYAWLNINNSSSNTSKNSSSFIQSHDTKENNNNNNNNDNNSNNNDKSATKGNTIFTKFFTHTSADTVKIREIVLEVDEIKEMARKEVYPELEDIITSIFC